MKINGHEVVGLPEEILVLPRGPNQQVVLKARAIPDFEEFDKLCPPPKPPGRLVKNVWEPNEKDPTYQDVLREYNRRRIAYMVVKSLEPSNIEWDTVKMESPSTWVNWEAEFKKSFSQIEINRVVQLVFDANCLNEEKLELARRSFLAGQTQVVESSGLTGGQPSTPSGEPAPVSA